MLLTALSLSAALALQPPVSPAAPPDDAGTDAPVTQLEEVEVVGQRLQEQVESFIDEVTAPPSGRNLARWDREICVGVVNMNNRYAQFMVDRVSERAVAAGLDVGEPGCRADILIAATDDAQGLATVLVQDNPEDFRPATGGTDMGSRALEQFQSGDAPVRWWYVSLPVSVDTGEIAIQLKGEQEPRTIVVRDASRLRANVRDDLVRIVVILDMTQIGQISFGALSDYVAMVTLAQIDPEADASQFDSILNLFSTESPPQTMTGWDEDFIQALYDAPRDRARSSQQTRYITREMREARLREELAAGSQNQNTP